MRILLYGINFAPEMTGIGKYTGEMAEWLSARGHEVRVVTAPPYYPQWRVAEGYGSSKYFTEKWGKVTVWRCPLWIPKTPGGLKRLVHLASFATSSVPAMLRQIGWRPNVVWVVEPALFCAPTAWLTARLSRSRAWLHIQDYEVDAAFELGVLRGTFARGLVSAWERWLMRRFDRVSTISDKMIEKALDKGMRKKKLVAFPNWVELSTLEPREDPNRLRAELGIGPDDIVALYSGTMGKKQGLELLAEAAGVSRERTNLVFVFCGNGPGRQDLQERCEGLPNVRFLELVPLERLGTLLAMADIHLLPQQAGAADLVMPSKLTGMLASGRPVVATFAEGTQVALVIGSRLGRVVPAGNVDAFVAALDELASDSELRRLLGAEARAYAEENLDRDKVLSRFEAALVECTRDAK